jgi:hypothetical protein
VREREKREREAVISAECNYKFTFSSPANVEKQNRGGGLKKRYFDTLQ